MCLGWCLGGTGRRVWRRGRGGLAVFLPIITVRRSVSRSSSVALSGDGGEPARLPNTHRCRRTRAEVKIVPLHGNGHHGKFRAAFEERKATATGNRLASRNGAKRGLVACVIVVWRNFSIRASTTARHKCRQRQRMTVPKLEPRVLPEEDLGRGRPSSLPDMHVICT